MIKIFYRFIIIFATLTINTHLVFSQSSLTGGQGYFIIGQNTFDISNLNSALILKNYPSLSDKFLSIGGGGYGVVKKLLIGGEGIASVGNTLTNNNYKLTSMGACGFFNLGYVIHRKNNLIIYPAIGIGGGIISLKISDTSQTTFDTILNTPQRNVELIKGAFLGKISLGSDWQIKPSPDAKPSLIIGCRIGYIFPFIKSEWMTEEVKLTNEPEIGFAGPFIHFTVGLGQL